MNDINDSLFTVKLYRHTPTTLQWLMYLLISLIPVVNLVFFLLWAFKEDVSESRANWAKANLMMVCLIGLIICMLILIFGFENVYNYVSGN